MANKQSIEDPWPPNDPEILATLQASFADGSWGRYQGPNCEALRAALAKMHDVEHTWLCSSGTIAVELALRGLKIGQDDEVILAGYDFAGNFRAIESVGAWPVLVDINPISWCINADEVEAAASDKTKCVIVSHLHGGIADMRMLREFADRHGISIVEDACQNPAAVVQGKPAGSWGDVGVLSFGGSKLLTAGRGGAIVTDRADVWQRIKSIAEQGNDAYPLSELQATVLLPQLARLADRNEERRIAASEIHAILRDAGFSPVTNHVQESQPSFFKFAFRAAERRQLLASLQSDGIPCGEGFRGFALRKRRARIDYDLNHTVVAAAESILLNHTILNSRGVEAVRRHFDESL